MWDCFVRQVRPLDGRGIGEAIHAFRLRREE